VHICRVLFRPYVIWPSRFVHATQPKIAVTYLIFTAELTQGLAQGHSIQYTVVSVDLPVPIPFTLYWSFCCWYILQSRTWIGFEASGLWLHLNLVVAGLDTIQIITQWACCNGVTVTILQKRANKKIKLLLSRA